MEKIKECTLEIIKVPGNMVRITGIGCVSLMSLYEGIYVTTPENDKIFISTDELITPRTKRVHGAMAKYNKERQRMEPLTHVQWNVQWLY